MHSVRKRPNGACIGLQLLPTATPQQTHLFAAIAEFQVCLRISLAQRVSILAAQHSLVNLNQAVHGALHRHALKLC